MLYWRNQVKIQRMQNLSMSFYLFIYLLYRYCDVLLKKSSKNPKDTEIIYVFLSISIYLYIYLSIFIYLFISISCIGIVMLYWRNQVRIQRMQNLSMSFYLSNYIYLYLYPYIYLYIYILYRYCDALLKKSSKNPEDAELEETLNQVE